MTINSFLSVNKLLTDRYSKFRTTITNPFLSINNLLTDRYIKYSEINHLLNIREGEYEQFKRNGEGIGTLINNSTTVFNNNPLFLLFTYYCELFNEFNRYEALLKQKNRSTNKEHIDTEVNNPLLDCEEQIKSMNEKIFTEIVKINTKTDQAIIDEQLNARKARKARNEKALEKQVKVPSQDQEEKIVREFIEEDNDNSYSVENLEPVKPGIEDIDIENMDNNYYIISAVKDGDCFISAIFDYGVYTESLPQIYSKIMAMDKYIQSKPIYKYEELKKSALEKLKIAYGSKYQKQHQKDKKDIDSFNIVNSYELFISIFYNDHNVKKIYNGIDYYRYGNTFTLNNYDNNTLYEKLRLSFVISMKYIIYIYVKTIGKKIFEKYIKDSIIGLGDVGEWILKEQYPELDNFLEELEIKIANGVIGTKFSNFDVESVMDFHIDNYLSKPTSVWTDAALISTFQQLLIRKVKGCNYRIDINTRQKGIYRFKVNNTNRILKDKTEKIYLHLLLKERHYFSLLPISENSNLGKYFLNKLNNIQSQSISYEIYEERLNEEAIRRMMSEIDGGKRIQPKSLQKSERVTNDPKKPSPKKPSPKKPCKSKQKSRLT
jgi:hypothetical protein